MLPRVLEPEVMDEPDEVEAYAAMPHEQVNVRFVDDLLSFCPRSSFLAVPRLLDLGTGTGQIPLILLERSSGWQITAVDQSAAMLEQAKRQADRVGQQEWTDWVLADACQLPYAAGSFDVVMSNSLVHHLPQPACCLREALRVLLPGGKLFVRDLFRPDNQAEVERLVQLYAGMDSALQQQLLRQSLQAALTPEELRELCDQIPGASWQIQTTSDRHWTLTAVKESIAGLTD